MDILGLRGYRVEHVQQTRTDYTITAATTAESESCPFCEVPDRLVKFGTKAQTVLDAPMRGKNVILKVNRQRYRCRNCGRTHSAPLLHIDERRNMTDRLVAYIREKALKHTFVQVAALVGVHEKTVRNIFGDWVARLEESREVVTPEWLGIDELKLVNGMRCVIADVKERRLVELLPKRDLRTVSAFLRSMPDRNRVQIVTMDMWRPYRDAAVAIFPAAQVVVDKFHIVRMANYCVDVVRKQARGDLTSGQRRHVMRKRFILFKRKRDLVPQEELELEIWGCHLPLLAEAYNAKEAFYGIWDQAGDADTASSLYDLWEKGLSDTVRSHFKVVTTAVKNWRKEIFAYFDVQATNAYTECLNGIIKVANRAGRGYSFDAIRAKVLYAGQRADDWESHPDLSDADQFAVNQAMQSGRSRGASTWRTLRRDYKPVDDSTRESE